MSVQASSWVWRNSQHKGSTLLVFLALADHMDAEGRGAWTAQKAIAEQVRLSERAVRYAVTRLESSGELGIDKRRGPHGTNLYSIPPMRQSLPHPRQARSARLPAKSNRLQATAIAPEPSFDPSIEPGRLTTQEFRNLSEEEQARYLGAVP